MKDKIIKVKFHNGNEEIVISSNYVEIVNSYSEEKKNEIKDMEFICYYNDVKDVRESQKVVSAKEEDKVEIVEGKKYEITDIQHPDYSFLHRIRALRDIRYGVEAGDLGGFIESEKNLSQEGDCWVSGNAQVYGNARVSGDALVCGSALIGGDMKVRSGIRE